LPAFYFHGLARVAREKLMLIVALQWDDRWRWSNG
jgi:hypothetical protein